MTTPVEELPQHLDERIRRLSSDEIDPDGDFVLYWMHHAARTHENAALDTALAVAVVLEKPVLVYSSLTPGIPYSSDRHHTFVLEGLQQVSRELSDRGIPFAFFLGRQPGEAPLEELASRACLVIVEDYPAPPYPGVNSVLSNRTGCPVWAVDAHCIVPMQLLGKPYARAFQFRKRIESLATERLDREWPLIETSVEPLRAALPFEPLDLESVDIQNVCAESEIDHSVGPVRHTQGGSDRGYERWRLFKENGLAGYAELRNNPTVEPPKGVSRLSPYLHYGHVSALTIGREARSSGSAGAEKFLDELVTWRELAFNLCHHRNGVESIEILPGWARDTLEEHRDDPREEIYTWEQMARGQTGDPLWNAAQTSLLRHGELHNNVRMTWGKRVLDWTPDPETALATLIDLNHRYALDGSDPASYGGLLWCLGLFDRPFGPERPVIGTVRPRSSASHAKRIDLDKYVSYVRRPVFGGNKQVAVVGAGMAGLAAARTLGDNGYDVKVYDKARGPGGRMATRRDEPFMFDHGAQYFTATDARFRRYVDSWKQQGLVQRWDAKIGVRGIPKAPDTGGEPTRDSSERLVGVPRMSALTRHLASGLDAEFDSLVTRLGYEDGRWALQLDETAAGPFDAVILTAPPEQTSALLRGVSPLAEITGPVSMDPCWALMVAFDQSLGSEYDAFFVNEGPLSWVARNSSKPGRPPAEAWVAHATPEWSRENLELEKGEIVEKLLPELFATVSVDRIRPDRIHVHRWRFARSGNNIGSSCLWDEGHRLAVAGDWVRGSRVEDAFLSGVAAAGRIMGVSE